MKNKNYYIIPIFVPHLGCQYQCIFCNQQKITGKERGKYPSTDEIEEKIHSYLSIMPAGKKTVELAYYGGSFTALPLSLQSELLLPAYKAVKRGIINKIRLSTRPDCLNDMIIKNLLKFQVTTVELGVQSFSDQVLNLARRGHSSQDVYKAVELLRKNHFQIGIQLMVGLPGETDQDLEQSIKQTIKLKPDFVRIYPVLVIDGTELAELFKQGLYNPLTLEQAVNKVKKMVLAFKKANIPVIRVGLQVTEELSEGSAVLAGPFHPAFRHLVESELYKDKLVFYLKNREEKNWIIQVHPRDISNVRGIYNSNLKYVEEKLKKKIVQVRKNEGIPRGELVLTAYLDAKDDH
ncbi:MAG TPA: radical SAM protein [Clostridia bacterium]|nr:radical SAM protein [Clostridia bacterium]